MDNTYVAVAEINTLDDTMNFNYNTHMNGNNLFYILYNFEDNNIEILDITTDNDKDKFIVNLSRNNNKSVQTLVNLIESYNYKCVSNKYLGDKYLKQLFRLPNGIVVGTVENELHGQKYLTVKIWGVYNRNVGLSEQFTKDKSQSEIRKMYRDSDYNRYGINRVTSSEIDVRFIKIENDLYYDNVKIVNRFDTEDYSYSIDIYRIYGIYNSKGYVNTFRVRELTQDYINDTLETLISKANIIGKKDFKLHYNKIDDSIIIYYITMQDIPNLVNKISKFLSLLIIASNISISITKEQLDSIYYNIKVDEITDINNHKLNILKDKLDKGIIKVKDY